jgi:hypothetical protein
MLMTTKTIRLTNSLTDAWVEQAIGTFLDERHYDTVYSGEVIDVFKPNGKLLFALRPRTIKSAAINLAYPALLRAAKVTNMRPVAAGGQANFCSGTIGYLNGEMTYATTSDPKGFSRIRPLLVNIDRAFAEHCSTHYARLTEAANQTTKRIIPTVFTSAAVNRNARMAIHRDEKNLAGALGAMTVIRAGDFSGGLLVFPKYRVAVDLQHGDRLIADNQEAHGNTSVLGDPGFTRISVVAYLHSSNLTK